MVHREPFRYQTRVRFIDTDAAGRIHYTAMFRYFEAAEIEFLRTVGVTYALDGGYIFPRVHVECDFKATLSLEELAQNGPGVERAARRSSELLSCLAARSRALCAHDDVIDIEVRLTKLGRSSARFDFRTLKGRQVAAAGAIVIACIDSHSQASAPIPDHLRNQLRPVLVHEVHS